MISFIYHEYTRNQAQGPVSGLAIYILRHAEVRLDTITCELEEGGDSDKCRHFDQGGMQIHRQGVFISSALQHVFEPFPADLIVGRGT